METFSDICRHQADELLEQAAHTPFPEVRDGLLQVVIVYERLADDAEKDDRGR